MCECIERACECVCVCLCTFALNCLVICLRLRRSFHRSAQMNFFSVCFGFICLFIHLFCLLVCILTPVYVNMVLSLCCCCCFFCSIYSIANCCKQQPYSCILIKQFFVAAVCERSDFIAHLTSITYPPTPRKRIYACEKMLSRIKTRNQEICVFVQHQMKDLEMSQMNTIQGVDKTIEVLMKVQMTFCFCFSS